jgi:membrane protease YdiL (CAAX protease family)
MGIVLGLCVLRTGSVRPTIAAHALWNLLIPLGMSPTRWMPANLMSLLLSAGGIAVGVAMLSRRPTNQQGLNQYR